MSTFTASIKMSDDDAAHVAALRLGKAIARETVGLDKAIKENDEDAETVHKENIADLYIALKGCDLGPNAPKIKEKLEQDIKLFQEPVAKDPNAHKEQQFKIIAALTRMQPFLRNAVGAKIVGGALCGVGAGASIAALSLLATDRPILFTDGSVRDLNSLDIKSLDGNNTTHLIDTDNNGLLDWQYTTDSQTGWVTEGGHDITQPDGLGDAVSAVFDGIVDFFSYL